MLRGFLRFFLTIFIVALIGLGLFDYLQNFDTNECTMTYMFDNPELIPVKLPPAIEKKFAQYKLFLYCEGNNCAHNEDLRFHRPGNIPVLFVTGNADSHKQVRSMASVSIDKSRNGRAIKFQYFTISFNEELSALYGPLLLRQTEFTKYCVEHILELFKGVKPDVYRPKSVLIIGNSMGGVVSRGLLVPSNKDDQFYKKNYVHTIITQASPHNRPVINIDKILADYYEKINRFWLDKSETSLNNVVLASLSGGTRDILVRTGLANINAWQNHSQAEIISSYTPSMPFVWRSIDHRCMAWCLELMLVLNRALFDLVDPETKQITENRQERQRVLKHYLQHDYMNDIKENQNYIVYSDITVKKLEIAESNEQLNFQLNDFIMQDKLILFNLKTYMNMTIHDSLFIYTNINVEKTFVICKDFRTIATNEYKCTEAKDLFESYGHSIPPLLEERRTETMRTFNIDDLAKLVTEQEYTYLVVRIPVWKKKSNVHQLFVKFDWYLHEKRVTNLELPSLKTNLQGVEVPTEGNVVFRRYYLLSFKDVLQAYRINKLENKCDIFLKDKSFKAKTAQQRPLSLSTTMLQFHELTEDRTNELILHSQAIQTKTKTLDIKLITNQNQTVPYIDVITFDIKHLLHHNSISQRTIIPDQCQNQIEIEIAYSSILGQFVRFFLVLAPAFIVSIIQFYDFLALRLKDIPDDSYKSYLFLNKVQTFFSYHMMHSLVINILVYVFHSDPIAQLVNTIDPHRSFLIVNDFELMKSEGIFHPCMGFLLYWCAYGLVSLSSYFLSILFNVLSGILNMLFRVFSLFRNEIVQKLLGLCHLLITIVMGLFSSALAHCSLFYGELMRLASDNPVYSLKSQNRDFSMEQSRLMMTYFLLVLNIPSVIVWTKSLIGSDVKPLYAIMPDCGVQVAVLSVILHQLRYFKRIFKVRMLDIADQCLAVCVLVNSFVTVLYASVSMYRLQYFILLHLFLMNFRKDGVNQSSSNEKPKQE